MSERARPARRGEEGDGVETYPEREAGREEERTRPCRPAPVRASKLWEEGEGEGVSQGSAEWGRWS